MSHNKSYSRSRNQSLRKLSAQSSVEIVYYIVCYYNVHLLYLYLPVFAIYKHSQTLVDTSITSAHCNNIQCHYLQAQSRPHMTYNVLVGR